MNLNKILKSSVFVGIASLLVWDSAFAQRGLRTRSKGGTGYRAPSQRGVGVGGAARQLPSEARVSNGRYNEVSNINGDRGPRAVDSGGAPVEMSSEFSTSYGLTAAEKLELRSATGADTLVDPIVEKAESIVELAQLDPNVTEAQLHEFVSISIAAGEWDPSAQENFLIFAENFESELETQQQPNVSLAVKNVSYALGLVDRNVAKREEKGEQCNMFGLAM